MKISKYLHSCILFDKDDFLLLSDPGTFSFAEGDVTPEQFSKVSAIIITHKHPDHLDIDNLQKIISLSKAPIYTNREVAGDLKEAGIECRILTDGDQKIGPFDVHCLPVKHEAILDSPLPEMTAYVLDGKVLNPGDSFDEVLQKFQGIELLLLPVMAPFATELNVAAFADKLKPKKIMPVHDGYAKPFFLEQRYKNYVKHFEKNGIEFLPVMEIGGGAEL